jgi:hypothetical protein
VSGTTPDGFRLAQCGSCNGAVIWASTSNGKSMPVDAVPVEDGNVEVLRAGGRVVATIHGQAPMIPVPLRKSHFATCPNADQHRKR